MVIQATKYPLTPNEIAVWIDNATAIQETNHIAYSVKDKTRSWVSFLLMKEFSLWIEELQDAINQLGVNCTIWPYLRSKYDHGTARTVIQSHASWSACLIASILDKIYLIL